MTLHALPSSARPREKILSRGASALADVELLALLLRTGVTGQGVLQWSQGLLDRFGGLAGLLQASPGALAGVKGLGPAKRAQVLAHNHPSGVAEPSRADEGLTHTLKSALQLVDVRVLDHLVVGQGQVVSMAERGLM